MSLVSKIRLFLLGTVLFVSSAEANHLAQGMRVLTSASAQIRSSPSSQASLAGTQLPRVVGTIVTGPIIAEDIRWWQIDYDAGADGWTDEANLVEAYFPLPDSAGGWRSLVARNTTPSATQLAVIRDKTGLDWNQLKLAADYSNTLSTGSAVIVIRNGWIVGEWGTTSSINVASVTKSLTGLSLAKLFD